MTLRKCWRCYRPIRKGERVIHRACTFIPERRDVPPDAIYQGPPDMSPDWVEGFVAGLEHRGVMYDSTRGDASRQGASLRDSAGASNRVLLRSLRSRGGGS